MAYEFRISGKNHIGYGQEAVQFYTTPEGVPAGKFPVVQKAFSLNPVFIFNDFKAHRSMFVLSFKQQTW